MSTINSSSLFHFTPKIDYLKKIVQDGVRFSFCLEEMDPEIIINEISIPCGDYDVFKTAVAKNNGVAIPMACFCDIPLLRTNDHKKKYGHYAIGLDKELLSYLYSSIMNPVIYVHSENVKALLKTLSFKKKQVYVDLFKKENIKQLHEEFQKGNMSQFEPGLDFKFEINNLIGLSKPCSLNNNNKTTYYYDEREWRALWPDNMSEATDWIWNISHHNFLEIKDNINQTLANTEKGHLDLPAWAVNKAITHIIVSRDKQIDGMIKHIMESKTIFGATVDEKEKLSLISKVTSFERINKDY